MSKGTRNAISSRGSEGGPTPSNSPAGVTATPGPAAVPVSRFRGQATGQAMPICDTSGPLFTASSPSAALQWSLANRLLDLSGASGFRRYVLTWKDWDMPAGPPICALRWSGHRTIVHACSLWPTPTASDTKARKLGNPHLTRNGTWRHVGKSGQQSATRLSQVANHLGRPDLAASIAFRAWMMGYPPRWTESAPRETVSSRKSRRRS